MSMAAPQKYICVVVLVDVSWVIIMKDPQRMVTQGLLKSWHMLPEKPSARVACAYPSTGRGGGTN